MSRLHVRVDDGLKSALAEVAEEYQIGMSDIVRAKIKEVIEKEEEAIPEDALIRAKVGTIKDGERPYQQAMHLPNNLFGTVQDQLSKRYPADPEEVRQSYVEPYEEIIEMCYDDPLKSRKIQQLQHALQTYERLHPGVETDPQDTAKAAVDVGVSVKIDNDMDTARDFVNGLVADGILRDRDRDEVMDRIRDKSKEEWWNDWEEARKANWEEHD